MAAARTVEFLQELQRAETGKVGPDGSSGETVSEEELTQLFNRFLSRSGGAKAFSEHLARQRIPEQFAKAGRRAMQRSRLRDRKSTRLNSSHVAISYAVFCLKKKEQQQPHRANA